MEIRLVSFHDDRMLSKRAEATEMRKSLDAAYLGIHGWLRFFFFVLLGIPFHMSAGVNLRRHEDIFF